MSFASVKGIPASTSTSRSSTTSPSNVKSVMSGVKVLRIFFDHLKLRRAVWLLDGLSTWYNWTSKVFRVSDGSYFQLLRCQWWHVQHGDHERHPCKETGRSGHGRQTTSGVGKVLSGQGGSRSRSQLVSCSSSRMTTICLAFTMKRLSLSGRKVHWLRKWFVLERPACLHKGQTLSWRGCLVRVLGSLLPPGRGRRKSSATAARRILASSEARISSRRELCAWEISDLI